MIAMPFLMFYNSFKNIDDLIKEVIINVDTMKKNLADINKKKFADSLKKESTTNNMKEKLADTIKKKSTVDVKKED